MLLAFMLLAFKRTALYELPANRSMDNQVASSHDLAYQKGSCDSKQLLIENNPIKRKRFSFKMRCCGKGEINKMIIDIT